MKRILVLGTYPIKKSQHGGQKRTEAIVSAYKSSSFRVVYSAVFFKGFYSDYSSWDIPVGRKTEKKVAKSPFMGDVACGEAIYEDDYVKGRISSLLLSFKPDIIHVEQPYPYIGLKKLLEEINMSPKIIFGSQNIEAPMKREILENAYIAEDEISKAEKYIKDLEIQLSKDCDLLAACTDSDLKAHKKMGAVNVVLAQNGIDTTVPTRESIRHWDKEFSSLGVSKTALFVGSAHPPNWIGFFDMVGKGLGFMPRDSRLVIAGSICDYFEKAITPASLNVQDATFWLRAYSAGRLSEDRLSSLIKTADVIILPITEGGGSNLKTAEAIIADKKVVATEHALRSFEWFKDFPNLWIPKTRQEFNESIVEALNAKKVERTLAQKKKAEEVRWSHRLSGLVEKAREL